MVLHTIVSIYVPFNFRKEKPAFGFHKVRADIFDRFFGSLPFRSCSRRGGRKGGVGGIPPAEPSQFRSDIFKQTPQIETSRFERADARRDGRTARDNFSRRKAANWLGGGNSKRADLSRTKGFVPIFWTNDFISEKLSDVAKKSACFVSKIHSRRGSTQFFLPRSKSFFFSCKAAKERMRTSFRVRYISFGTSPSKYIDTSFSMHPSFALIFAERF